MRGIFVNLTLKCLRPINPDYPKELLTLGDHLRSVRLDRGLPQAQVAKLLKVTSVTVTAWEFNRHEPPMRLAKRIVAFLGYLPDQGYGFSLGGQEINRTVICAHRMKNECKICKRTLINA
ncbi:MAG: helix-turn-helix transcriptional regulator [Saprospiraceae bacterium]